MATHPREREAKIIWILADAIGSTWADRLLDGLRLAIERLRRHVIQKHDKAMNQTIDLIHGFVKEVLGDGSVEVSREIQMAYFHMLNALISDRWIELHKKSSAQRLAWIALSNAVIDFLDAAGGTDVGYIEGCRFAERIHELIK